MGPWSLLHSLGSIIFGGGASSRSESLSEEEEEEEEELRDALRSSEEVSAKMTDSRGLSKAMQVPIPPSGFDNKNMDTCNTNSVDCDKSECNDGWKYLEDI